VLHVRYVLQIVGRVDRVATEYDGTYVVRYDPTAYDAEHKGGILEVTHDPEHARYFDQPGHALECWRQTSGRTRPDGKADRPLTAFHAMVIKESELAKAHADSD
jgi:hypothetical protein